MYMYIIWSVFRILYVCILSSPFWLAIMKVFGRLVGKFFGKLSGRFRRMQHNTLD